MSTALTHAEVLERRVHTRVIHQQRSAPLRVAAPLSNEKEHGYRQDTAHPPTRPPALPRSPQATCLAIVFIRNRSHEILSHDSALFRNIGRPLRVQLARGRRSIPECNTRNLIPAQFDCSLNQPFVHTALTGSRNVRLANAITADVYLRSNQHAMSAKRQSTSCSMKPIRRTPIRCSSKHSCRTFPAGRREWQGILDGQKEGQRRASSCKLDCQGGNHYCDDKPMGYKHKKIVVQAGSGLAGAHQEGSSHP